MDVFQSVSGYVTKMVSAGDSATTGGAAKMKVLLLDQDTVPIVSSATTQSALLNHSVYLTERIDNVEREKMRHLRCLCFMRPSSDSIQFLIDELREPKYGEYHIYFSNIIKKSSLERLAEADDHEVVKGIVEYFADFIVINPDLCNLPLSTRIFSSAPDSWNHDSLTRTTEGVMAMLLALKKKPLIRYEKHSMLCKKLATEARYSMTQEEQLFDFRKPDTPPILLLVDRRDDPVTPLLTQWTYQAMVHELLSIDNGRVTLVTELSRRVGTDNLLDVSELEQSLACNDNHSQDVKTLQQLIQNPSVPPSNKLKLVAIYALRYAGHTNNNTPALLELLSVAGGVSRHRINLIHKLLTYASSLQSAQQGAAGGLPDLFQPAQNIFSEARSRFNRGLRGVENVYTQHSPRLETTLQDLIKGRLSPNTHPFIEGQTRDKPQDIIVFIVGGTTYEEAKMVAQINASSPGVRVVLGGTGVHNSTSFLDEVEEAVDAWPEPRPDTAAGRLRREVGRA